MKKSAPNSPDEKRTRLDSEPQTTSQLRSSKDIPDEKVRFSKRAKLDIIKLIHMPSDMDDEEKLDNVLSALESYKRINPSEGLEEMLATQMVGTHQAALACLRRAAVPEQSFEGFDMTMKNATKLMALYAQQMAALDKHRGKGQQKVTVEYVYLEAGAQAVIGNIENDPKAPGKPPTHVEVQRDVPMNLSPNLPQKRRRK